MDTLTLSSLQFQAKHGYYERERAEGNFFEVDLVFGLDLSAAGTADDLDKTIDYQAAERIAREVMQAPSVKLIETLAQRIGDNLFHAFPITEKLEVRVRKINPPLETKTRYSEVVKKWQR